MPFFTAQFLARPKGGCAEIFRRYKFVFWDIFLEPVFGLAHLRKWEVALHSGLQFEAVDAATLFGTLVRLLALEEEVSALIDRGPDR